MLRLFGLTSLKYPSCPVVVRAPDRCMNGANRVGSGRPSDSTLTDVGAVIGEDAVQYGPASTQVRSSTLMPASGRVLEFRLGRPDFRGRQSPAGPGAHPAPPPRDPGRAPPSGNANRSRDSRVTPSGETTSTRSRVVQLRLTSNSSGRSTADHGSLRDCAATRTLPSSTCRGSAAPPRRRVPGDAFRSTGSPQRGSVRSSAAPSSTSQASTRPTCGDCRPARRPGSVGGTEQPVRHQRVHPSGPRRYPVLVQIRSVPRSRLAATHSCAETSIAGTGPSRRARRPRSAPSRRYTPASCSPAPGEAAEEGRPGSPPGQHATEGGDGEIRCRPIPARSVDAERGHPHMNGRIGGHRYRFCTGGAAVEEDGPMRRPTGRGHRVRRPIRDRLRRTSFRRASGRTRARRTRAGWDRRRPVRTSTTS